jgi:Tol biopolymer transport system component
LASGAQPRVSPKNDAILFTQVNEKTGNRDIFRVSDKGGVPENLTDSPDSDQYDAVWSKDGGRIAFVSDRGVTDDNRRNAGIWVIDLLHGQSPRQVTHNGSQDDCPAWDPSGNFIYFRSNRGGEWQVWRVAAR